MEEQFGKQAIKCFICEAECDTFDKNEFFPFCSARCRLVDLGKWLGEEYFIPEKLSSSEDEE